MAPVERREGGAPSRRGAGLTIDDLVQAALRVITEIGVDNLTMRHIAEDLGVTTMAAYHHVRSKDEILDLALAEVLRASTESHGVDADAPWDEFLRARVHATFDALARYPGLAAVAMRRPLTAADREGMQRSVDVLVGAGLPRSEAEQANATLHTYVFGLAGMEAQFRPRKRRGTDRAILVDVDVDAFVDFGLDLLLSGIAAKITDAARTG